MKITEVLPSWFEYPITIKIGAMPRFKITGTILRIKTDEGIEGIAGTHFVNADKGLVAHIKGWEKILLKKDPLEIEKIWRDIYNTTNRISFGIAQSISIIDCALWDIKGKALGKPVYRLLGGYQDKVKAYASFPWWVNPKAIASFLDPALERGFKAVKVRIGKNLDWDERVLKTVRDLGGIDLEIMADVNSGYNSRQALKIARVAERLDLRWLEEPLPSDNLTGLAELRSKVNIDIAGGENDAFTWRFREILEKAAYDIIQPDVTRSGGITEVKKIAAIAESHSKLCINHIFGIGPIQYANLQLIGAVSNCPYMEYGFYPDEFLMTTAPIEIKKDGMAIIPSSPGLGFEIDEAVFNKYKQT
ncbi:MAG: mandelate racemase/muconate lactonizing enzyme family protein [Candidatus Helarchaeota archaeon]|nr:mandelate racemase/muconate lactonizing enzyme family protein [Candidatus Helarchaeota archaeon]